MKHVSTNSLPKRLGNEEDKRAAQRRPLALPARLTWKDQRGATRFASVVMLNVSEHGAMSSASRRCRFRSSASSNFNSNVRSASRTCFPKRPRGTDSFGGSSRFAGQHVGHAARAGAAPHGGSTPPRGRSRRGSRDGVVSGRDHNLQLRIRN
jgi:hypothetical protein